jgi:hypothetical protein
MSQLPWILGVFILGAILSVVAVSMTMRERSNFNDYPTLRTAINDARAKAAVQGGTLALSKNGTGSKLTVTDSAGATTPYSFPDSILINGLATVSIDVTASGVASSASITTATATVSLGGAGTCTLSLQPLALEPTGACAPH